MPELGILGSGEIVAADSFGNLSWLNQNTKRINWGIGADDRWHFAENEKSVRQTLSDDGVLSEARMRVPGGDIVQRMDVIPVGIDSAVLLEFENETPVPVAVAVILENYRNIEIDGASAYVKSLQVVHASKPIALCCSSDNIEMLQTSIENGVSQPPSKPQNLKAAKSTALIFPLPHATKLRLVISRNGYSELPNPGQCPSFDEIANGWRKHLDVGMQISIPENRILNAINASRRHLLIGSGQPVESEFWIKENPEEVVPLSAAALFQWGYLEVGKDLLLKCMQLSNPGLFRRKVPRKTLFTLWAWEIYIRLSSDDRMAEILLPWVQETLQLLLSTLPSKRRRRGRELSLEIAALQSATEILKKAGEANLAAEVAAQLDHIRSSISASSATNPLDRALLGSEKLLDEFIAAFKNRQTLSNSTITVSSSATGSDSTGSFSKDSRTQDPMSSALFLILSRKAFLTEQNPFSDSNTLLLNEGFHSDWIGAPIEVENAPIHGGSFGFAIRWHGVAPALLWAATTDAAITIRTPRLDKDWFTNDLEGETLLAQQELPETAVTIVDPAKTLAKPNTPNSDDGDEGGSFR
ncbi:MAG: hypothetical protein VX353_00020 [Actinomycetota bacterium]